MNLIAVDIHSGEMTGLQGTVLPRSLTLRELADFLTF